MRVSSILAFLAYSFSTLASAPPCGASVLELILQCAGGPAPFDYTWICAVERDQRSIDSAVERLLRSSGARHDWARIQSEMEADLRQLPHARKATPWIRSTPTRRRVYMALAARAAEKSDAGAARILFVLGGIDYSAFPRQMWAERVADDSFRALLRLPPDQEREALRLSRDVLNGSSQFMSSFRKVIEAADELIRAEGAIPVDVLGHFLSDFAEAWASQNVNPTSQETLASVFWRVCCLLKHRDEEANLTEMRSRAAALQASTVDRIAAGWLEQAAQGDGPLPENSGVKVIRGPNDLKRGP